MPRCSGLKGRGCFYTQHKTLFTRCLRYYVLKEGTSPQSYEAELPSHNAPSIGSSLISFIRSLSVSSRPILFIIAGRNLMSNFDPLKNIKYYHPKHYKYFKRQCNVKEGFLNLREKLKTLKYMFIESRWSHAIFTAYIEMLGHIL